MSRVTTRRKAVLVRAGEGSKPKRETLAGEEPLEIRVNGKPLAVTMRTPGHDFDLVAGNLVSEGFLGGQQDLATMRYCAGKNEEGEQTFNVIDAAVIGLNPASISERRVVTTSACGVCGTTSIDEVTRQSRFGAHPTDTRIQADILLDLPDRLREAQKLFDTTGGLHAAGLFTTDGELLCAREDVGRHNAVDKVIGWALREGKLPLRGTVMQVSGRASFELVQKCHLAGIPIMSAVSAPSSLAADLADEVGITLAGFSRGDRITLYTHPDRVEVVEDFVTEGASTS
ncbi:formate dehydrogenase accessory sulfurtransferase FdhD [Gulosibacter molinativorax]|uniref:Sulfur carrier protein FdhD n=1 Tax=Gulosibacter molinativorax TaxID=256821 RepID=A0ABT7CCN3_9MICO|nr:formate dehydrogenase accessory sulfurtransferase FdhD [Gulosibacter molinativorax]MDJ1372346.1 formate dehydrogenase accessory sulfurtransferase FdhD [Gulosibacter molinativorax]QUY63564.1 Sulfurtransferase FdhD [Gulosibacter molinativorax]